ncbi:MAG: VWA domain-containing protein, partial [Acidobacteriota bacterium]|nr:VWA domain-containing protein [Acidobacteriota bacterium]
LGLRESEVLGDKTDPLHFMIAPLAREDLSAQELTVSGSGSSAGKEAHGQIEQVLLEHLQALSQAADKVEKSYARTRITAFTRSLGDMAKALSVVPGRKDVVLFSEGFDSRLLLGRENLADDEAEKDNFNIAFGNLWQVDNDNRYGNTELQNSVNRMLEQFRRANCVIQAVDIGGLRAGGDVQENSHGTGQEELFYLANETGGELFKDTNDLSGQLDRVLARSTVTYLLSFERGNLKADGAYRKLRIKAKLPPGAHLTYRSGYYAPRPWKGLDPLEKSLLASDRIAVAKPRSGFGVNLLVAPFRAGGTRAYVPVIIEVAGDSLLAEQKGDRLNIELYAYVSNAKGEMRDFFTQRVALDLKKGREALRRTGLKYYGHLDLPAGEYRVRVLVRNSETGRTGVESAPLTVPSYAETRPVLLPPLFIEGRQSWVMVRERAREGAQQSVVYPFTVNGEPYVPAAKPALGREDQARVCLVGYNLGAGDLAISGQVTGVDGAVQAGGTLSLLERTATGVSGLDKLLATFRPSGLKAGDYVLQVAVADSATGRRQTNSLAFHVNP